MFEKRVIGEGDSWPEAVSDGLTLPCSICWRVPALDYLVSDATWDYAVPEKHRRGVVCLECLLERCPEAAMDVRRIHVVGGGLTLEMRPAVLYDYRARIAGGE